MKRPIPLGSLLKKQPAFGYHQAMYRAVLKLFVGVLLALTLSPGQSIASSYKSDGNVSTGGTELSSIINQLDIIGRDLYFDFDSASLTASSKEKLSNLASYMKPG